MPAYPCCRRIACDICLTGRAPAQLQVVLGGFSAGELCDSAACQAGYDGTYVLDYAVCIPTSDPFGPWHVAYEFSQATQPCVLESINCLIYWDENQSFPKGTILVALVGGFGDSYVFQLDGDDVNKVDCMTLSRLEIPFESQFSTGHCDASTATCEVTTL